MQYKEYMMANWMGTRSEVLSTMVNAYYPFLNHVIETGATLTEEMLTSMLMVRQPLLYTGAHVKVDVRQLKVILNTGRTQQPFLPYHTHSHLHTFLLQTSPTLPTVKVSAEVSVRYFHLMKNVIVLLGLLLANIAWGKWTAKINKQKG